MDEEKLTDAALLPLCRTSETALETMIRRYFRLVTACARPYFLVGGEESDLIQEGLIGLLSAIRSYDCAAQTGFASYASLCIRRRMISAVRAACAAKNAPLNESVPLEELLPAPAEAGDPEALYLGKEQAELLTGALEDRLSGFERQVLALYLEGCSVREIAETKNKPVKSVENAIQRIRGKIKFWR